MKTYTQTELLEILAQHKLWLNGEGGSRANLSGANLSRANLSDANLSWVDLSGANLSDAYLSRANLSDANLSDADLSGANLSDANLSWAYLSRANLSDANLSDADLSWAYLSGADLSGVNLSGADLSGVNLSWADLSGANLSVHVPFVENVDGKTLDAINRDGNGLDMESWHTCETTHCRAGWYITLAGEGGKVLESIYGSSAAAALIFKKSYPDKIIPNWLASNDDAMASMVANNEEWLAKNTNV